MDLDIQAGVFQTESAFKIKKKYIYILMSTNYKMLNLQKEHENNIFISS